MSPRQRPIDGRSAQIQQLANPQQFLLCFLVLVGGASFSLTNQVTCKQLARQSMVRLGISLQLQTGALRLANIAGLAAQPGCEDSLDH